MPLTVDGEGYRDFSEPRFFETTSTAEVEQIRQPVHKAHALVGVADGSTTLGLWKFDSASVAAASATVLVPDNPAYASIGRWINIPVGGGSGGGGTFSGAGTPEGTKVAPVGSTYWDTTNLIFYVKNTGVGNTGWRELIA